MTVNMQSSILGCDAIQFGRLVSTFQLSYPTGGSSTFLWNVDSYLPFYMAAHPWRLCPSWFIAWLTVLNEIFNCFKVFVIISKSYWHPVNQFYLPVTAIWWVALACLSGNLYGMPWIGEILTCGSSKLKQSNTSSNNNYTNTVIWTMTTNSVKHCTAWWWLGHSQKA